MHYAARNGSSKLIKVILKSSGISTDDIRQLLSTTNIKLKFPEDLAKTSICKEVLRSFRQYGEYRKPGEKA